MINCHSINAAKPKFSPDQERHSWVILYWMPYDNDLSHFGEPIVEMLLPAPKNLIALDRPEPLEVGGRRGGCQGGKPSGLAAPVFLQGVE